MNLSSKQAEVSSLAEKFKAVHAAFLVDFKGCTCEELVKARAALREGGASLKVVKNTLAKRAVVELGVEGFEAKFNGPTAVVFSEEAATTAKALTGLAKDVESFELKGGVVEGAIVEEKDIEALSKLPSKEELQAKLLSVLNAPATKLVGTLNAPATQLVRLLAAWRDELEKKEA